jgi:predicted lipoprotein with Yx(FWY)xxD motif
MPTTSRSRTAAALIATSAALATLALLLLHPSPSDGAQARGPLVSTATSSLGRVLVNAQGHTLYLFGKDKNGKSACSGMCATNWPPLIATAKARAAGGVKASRLGTTKRADGRLQVTYNHHPLYTFIKDTKKGQTNGEGLNAFGGVWDAVSSAGAKVVKANAAPAPATSGNGVY